MRPQEIENWIQAILNNILQKKIVEDSRIELKRDWPTDFYKTSRQIAGHANAAFGDKILWIIGVDEESFSLVNSNPPEMAQWKDQLFAHFQGNIPSIQYIATQKDNFQIGGLLIETDQAPYVIKNPDFGSSKSKISLEIPFRDGTAVRSARHEDIVRILIPQQRKPHIENLKFHGQATTDPKKQFHYEITTYFTMPYIPENPTIFPCHLAELRIAIPNLEFQCENVAIGLSMGGLTIRGGGSEILVYGPGIVTISGQFYPNDYEYQSVIESDELQFQMLLKSFDKEITVQSNGKMCRMDESHRRDNYPPYVWGNQL